MTAIASQPIDIRAFCKRPTTKLVVQHLEYWFRGKKKNGFFKFSAPCDHKLYREGDSWTEELGISRNSFKRHFDLVGTRWPSKSSFEESKDPFLGKPYTCYYDRKENVTRYFKNPSCSTSSKSMTMSLLKSEKEKVREQISNKIANKQSFQNTIKKETVLSKPNSTSRMAKKDAPLYTRLTTDKYTYLSNETEKKLEEVQKIWKKEVGGTTYTSKTFLKKLLEAFNLLFKGSLDLWKKYCRKIASSKFLMGEVSGFKAWITWAIKPDTVKRLEAGEFTLGDRESKESVKEKTKEVAIEAKKHIETLSGKEKAVHTFLKERVGDSQYLSWFKESRLTCTPSNKPFLAMGSDFKASYIKNTFKIDLEALKNEFFLKEGGLSIIK